MFDGHAGLHDNGYRAYDPATGRYPQSDPFGLMGGSFSTYAYAVANPLSASDPTGLYLSFVHRGFTEQGATAAGWSAADAAALAQGVVDADNGTQSIADAYRYAMCAARSTPDACEQKYKDFVASELKKCTRQGLANAIHAVQDSFSQSHKGFQWYGGTLALMVPLLGLDHVIADATPGRTEQYEVPRTTAEIIRTWHKSVVAMQSDIVPSQNTSRGARYGLLICLVAECVILMLVGFKYRGSWSDELIGLTVFAAGLLLPSVIAIDRLSDPSRMAQRAHVVKPLLVWGAGFGLLIPLAGIWVGVHGAAPVVILGLAVQAVIHTIAVRRLGHSIHI